MSRNELVQGKIDLCNRCSADGTAVGRAEVWADGVKATKVEVWADGAEAIQAEVYAHGVEASKAEGVKASKAEV